LRSLRLCGEIVFHFKAPCLLSSLFTAENPFFHNGINIAVQAVTFEKGKPFERMERKGTGLNPWVAGYGSGSAGRKHLLDNLGALRTG